jgi:hypothetical protein
VTTAASEIDAMERAAKHAGRACLVTMALDVPVHVDVSVRPLTRTLEVVA